jgi:hypothetical protein
MANFAVTPVDTTFAVQVGENTTAAAASATLAQAWAEGTLPGGAGTKSAKEHAQDAEGFADDAEAARDIAVAAAAIANEGIDLEYPGPWIDADKIGFIQSGTGASSRTVQAKLDELRTPSDHSVTYDGSGADATRIANFFASAAPTVGYSGEFFRNGGRTYLGDWSVFNGAFGGYFDYTGLSPLTRALHNWAPREATLGVDSHWGSMAIVGHSLASKRANWPAAATSFQPATIGVSGFAINDMPVGQAWGLYGDAARMPNCDGFTAGLELAVANFGDNSTTTPYTLTNGSVKGGVGLWVQSGAGMSLIPSDIAQEGFEVSDVNHLSAIAGFTGLQQLQLDYPNWANSTAYAVGDIREDTASNTIFRCLVAHTSPASGTFAADRTANPNRWKQNPGALSGIVFGVGALAERNPGANIFSAIEMPERHVINWQRKTAGGAIEEAAVIFADEMPDGTPATQLIFRPYSVYTNGIWAGSADGTTGAMIQGRGSGGANAFSFRWTGTNVEIYVDNTLVKTI